MSSESNVNKNYGTTNINNVDQSVISKYIEISIKSEVLNEYTTVLHQYLFCEIHLE